MNESNNSCQKHKIYKDLTKLRKRLEKFKPVKLYNRNFKHGTYIIDKPGYYVLCEDIVFNPNKCHDYMPRSDQEKYQGKGYSLGFFAAISITCKEGVYLNLNKHSLQQSKAHALQQRFFALIELASAPFIPKQGPGDFGSEVEYAENVVIRNGKLGLSSHHSLHGNFCKNILLEHLHFTDFEIAAVALNGGDGLIFRKLCIGKNRQDVPVLGTYSAARFGKQFGEYLLSHYDDLLDSEDKENLEQSLAALNKRMKDTFKQVMKKGHTKDPLFKNTSGLVDGNVYGFLLHSPGVAVNHFDLEDPSLDPTEHVWLDRVIVKDIKVKVNEIIGLSGKEGVGVQNDPSGAVFQIDKVTDENGLYRGNTLSRYQLLLAELSLKYQIPIGKNNITQDTINWANGGYDINQLLNDGNGYEYKLNGDTMFHVNKGVVAYRFDCVRDLKIEKCSLVGLKNYGRLGNETKGGAYSLSHDQQVRPGYHGGDTMGFCFAYCRDVKMFDTKIVNVVSKNGDAYGINIINGTENQYIEHICINGIYAGTKRKCGWLGEDYYGNKVEYNDELPNSLPDSIGIRIDNTSENIKIKCKYISNLVAPGKTIPILREE